MPDEAQVRARNIEVSRRAALRLTTAGGYRTPAWLPPPPDMTIETGTYFVYTLLNEYDQVIYVGQTGNIFSRMAAHLTDPSKKKLINRIGFYRCHSRGEALSLERQMIRYFNPSLNVRLRESA